MKQQESFDFDKHERAMRKINSMNIKDVQELMKFKTEEQQTNRLQLKNGKLPLMLGKEVDTREFDIEQYADMNDKRLDFLDNFNKNTERDINKKI